MNKNLELVKSILTSNKFQNSTPDQKKIVIDTILASKKISQKDIDTILAEDRDKNRNQSGNSSRPAVTGRVISPQSQKPGFDILQEVSSNYNDKLIVYILGAGPVGLLTAIKLVDAYKDKVRVVLFEKRSTYTRERVLFINKYVIQQLLPKQLLTNSKLVEYGCSFNDVPSADLATCDPIESLQNVKRLAISTRVLEDSLKELLLTDEYNKYVDFIIYDKIDKAYIEEVNDKFTPHVFVGADAGALSFNLYSEEFGVTS
jgi:hypothetical protein